MKKSVKISLIAAAVLLAFVVFVKMCSRDTTQVVYATQTVERQDLYKLVTATGALEPVNKVEVGTQVSGIIDKIYVDFNSVVKKGQLLAEMDRTTLIADVTSAKASLTSAEVEMEYQTRNFERYTTLHEKGLVSDTDYEQAEYNYNKARQSLSSQRSNMSKVNRNLEYATITSPIDGVVLSREVEEGQTVASGFNTPTLFTIAANLTEMEVIADVDEADIGYVEEGQRVLFQVDAFPDETFEGSVAQVRLNPTTTSNVVTYEVVVNAPNPDQKLKPGMTANITIYTRESRNALTVPMKALRFTPDVLPAGYTAPEGKYEETVWVLKGENPVPVTVTTGINNGVDAVISGDGISEGDKVVTGYEKVGGKASVGGFPTPPMGGGPGGPRP